MAQFSSPASLFLVLLALLSAKTMVSGCQQAVIGGGCPDLSQCMETCRPCYRGIGEVHVFCRPAGGGILFDECVCSMEKGAPCNPPGPPQCPRPWPPPATSATNLTETLQHHH
ncbi:hypothetical protein L6164_025701 [Bauhinia variegata]|uniref:Uncharacterized protein n=1 Tax=Bauhinia variegata TaxID=167791 RepID=A0ACB9M4T7_BAUVA|nr:hypothetical protein L6164_025701 [Bauhinia variegata]